MSRRAASRDRAATPRTRRRSTIVELDLRGVLGYTDYFVVCSGNTGARRRRSTTASSRGCKREHDAAAAPRRGLGAGADWILMDYLDVVVHIFTPETREFYRLEQLWGEAPARVARRRGGLGAGCNRRSTRHLSATRAVVRGSRR